MGISELLTQLANPQTMKALPLADKLVGGAIVTCLGMGITFFALILLQFLMGLQSKIISRVEQKFAAAPRPPAANAKKPAAPPVAAADADEELIAVLAAAVAMEMRQPPGAIRIRTVRKIEEPCPAWSRAGMFDQMNTRL